MGTNATQQVLQQGMGLFDDIQDFMNERNDERNAAADTRGRAGLIETDAAGDAQGIRRRAGQDAAGLRGERERSRAGDNARWGGSGLAMSGSKALIRDARRVKDRQDEEDMLFEGEMDAGSRLRSARNHANMLRIDGGGSPVRSTLSMGSKIYGTRS